MYPDMKRQQVIIEAEIGKRIKALRSENGVTLERLALQTGFSKGYLSKVEKSEKAPPVSTLGTIARAFGVSISFLLGEENFQTSISMVKRRERPLIARGGSTFGYSYEAVAYNFKNKMMEPFVLTLPVHQQKKTVFQHEGQELLFVLQGTMKFLYGTEEYIVGKGDCIYFDSSVPHFGESMGERAVKCFMVIYNPVPGSRWESGCDT